MTIDNKQWWKGTFPSWMVACLMSIIAALLIHLAQEQRIVNAQVMQTKSDVEIHRYMIIELKDTNERLGNKFDRLADKIEEVRKDVKKL